MSQSPTSTAAGRGWYLGQGLGRLVGAVVQVLLGQRQQKVRVELDQVLDAVGQRRDAGHVQLEGPAQVVQRQRRTAALCTNPKVASLTTARPYGTFFF